MLGLPKLAFSQQVHHEGPARMMRVWGHAVNHCMAHRSQVLCIACSTAVVIINVVRLKQHHMTPNICYQDAICLAVYLGTPDFIVCTCTNSYFPVFRQGAVPQILIVANGSAIRCDHLPYDAANHVALCCPTHAAEQDKLPRRVSSDW